MSPAERLSAWVVQSVADALVTPWFRIRRYVARPSPHAPPVEYYVHQAPDSVLCVSVTTEGFVLVQREYRLPLDRVSMDFPGGAMEPADATPEDAVLRELREETGITAREPRLLASLDKDPGFSGARVHVFLVQGVGLADGDGRAEEHIELVPLRPAEVMKAVEEGELSCCFCVAAALTAARHLGW